MSHPLLRSAMVAATVGVAALTLTGQEASAQDGCTPGAFGEGASLNVSQGDDKAVTAVHLDFQCGDVLADGTYIPTGYRVELEGECGDAACDYPLAFVFATARPDSYQGGFVRDGEDVVIRLRKANRGTRLVMISQEPGGRGNGNKPTRGRYRLKE